MDTYVLSFPSDLRADMVKAFVSALSGMQTNSIFGLSSAPTVAFELQATDRGLTHKMRLSATHSDFVAAQLRTLVPGSRLEAMTYRTAGMVNETDDPAGGWDYAVELGVSNPGHCLRIPKIETLSASLLASLHTLSPGESVLLQMVVMPVPAQKPPSEPRPARRRMRSFGDVVRAVTPPPSKDEVQDRRPSSVSLTSSACCVSLLVAALMGAQSNSSNGFVMPSGS